MKPETYYNAYRVTAITSLLFALYACWNWLGVPYLQQQVTRSEAEQICFKHRACREVSAAFVLNPQKNTPERKLVVVFRKGASDKESQALFRDVKAMMDKHLTGEHSAAAYAMLPLEVRYE